ncbi:hypothetical protein PFICI_11380 [Pestalotiopsis fici W106-1]|uniref:Xylanolytic transcriptional activator regulatory domain-containing protein n=1 Tax=Pestalotiopsis fici (strain W106-1 / CGMCC3.15140) TaxID=1229662 RepID=W3WX96_PESFW|nr:uncharacterized protein PFICI_11380 [Pestalotiopsis fici W106-1]ETS77506.1 hypothetical protein PFICI_11380 [Pestalotiopsis fici W106-1]
MHQRPVPKSYVQALERSVASLELFIQQLHDADHSKRDEMLKGYVLKLEKPKPNSPPADGRMDPSTEIELALARARAGQLRKLRAGNASQFFGGTSLFQIHGDEPPATQPQHHQGNEVLSPSFAQTQAFSPSAVSDPGQFPYSAHDDMCQNLMAHFFRSQYPYNMCVYREFFLRDYDIGVGRYYSEVLLYAICAMGALASADPSMLAISEIFASQAEFLVYTSLDKPDLTLLQAMILLGYRFIGHGKASKGWLFCGMAFRLAHEMGLHLDPNNWGQSEPVLDRDREISRRVYWSAFNADKQVSLYFGRPPALYPHESDVRNTIRIPYPDDWQGLLETYIAKNTSATAFEDGIALSGSFIYRTELYKIIHTMITDLFENRRQNADSAVMAATAQRIHVSLHKWLATLPSKLYWNQWSSGQVQPFVLHLHMLFHTAMIILHRPPRHLFSKPGVAESEDVEICYESLQALLRLMKTYARFYQYAALPLDFVHTLSVTAGTLLMKRYLENAAQEDSGIARAMQIVLEAMDAVKYTWPCIVEIKESVERAMEAQPRSQSEMEGGARDPVLDFGFLVDFGGVGNGGDGSSVAGANRPDFQISDADLGLLLDEGFAMDQFDFNDPLTGQTLTLDENT